MKKIFYLIKEIYHHWTADQVSQMAAALSYYTIFSLTPLLIIFIAIAAPILGREITQAHILEQINSLVGPEAGAQVQMMLANASRPATGFIASMVSFLIFLFGAAGCFRQLQLGLNTIWKVEHVTSHFSRALKSRILSFALVISIGFLLLVTLILTTLMTLLSNYIIEVVPFGSDVWRGLSILFSLIFLTVFFAMIFKFLPDRNLKWRDVGWGAFITAVLFTLGKHVLGIYLSQVNIASIYGSAGSLVVILIWIYYSAQILFLGAEITKVYVMEVEQKGPPTLKNQ